MRNALAPVLLLTCVGLTGQERLLQPGDVPARQTAAGVLTLGVDSLRDLGPALGGERLMASLATARLCLPEGSVARATADELLAQPMTPKALASSVRALVADLTFQPMSEAELPAGVPGFQALDELELRHYPTYRMVRTDMKGGTMGAFWPLFQHIQEHQIAMTTPVQIDYRADGERLREASMAFLYGSQVLGETGKTGRVEVIDMPSVTVLTLGSRGHDRPSRITEMRERLEAWLAAHPEWRAAGDVRTMGYNSPSVRSERRYFEVQIPVQPQRVSPQARESV